MTQGSSETPKDASASVVAQQTAMLQALPFSDTRDFDDASRGFLGTLESARITSAQGRVVWSLEPYGFLSDEKAPATVNPSLWRQARLNMNHGIFEVVPGVHQVRGLDIANMTLIEGDTGVIVGGHADLDRRRARRDGALFPAPRQTAGGGRDLHPHPYRPMESTTDICGYRFRGNDV
jgi:alkyl sulfatase BDS1-like metallo-beta-lactamase superfamily hydrolase